VHEVAIGVDFDGCGHCMLGDWDEGGSCCGVGSWGP
jgi:hypothetical protein